MSCTKKTQDPAAIAGLYVVRNGEEWNRGAAVKTNSDLTEYRSPWPMREHDGVYELHPGGILVQGDDGKIYVS